MILPNVNIVEDDREEIPMIFIEKQCEGVSFALINGFKIKSSVAMYFDPEEFKASLKQNFATNKKFTQFFQLTPSSGVISNTDIINNNEPFYYQNF
jgi:uncharacterized protein YbcV (DUF1398 family)